MSSEMALIGFLVLYISLFFWYAVGWFT